MSFFSSISLSLSPHHRHYRGGHYGSGYYQRKGILGNLVDAFLSRSHDYYYNGYADPNININVHANPNGQPVNPQQYQQPYPSAQPRQMSASICAGCNSQIPAGSKFCLNCGAKVMPDVPQPNAGGALYCPNCGEGLPQGARFCQKCGTKLG